MKTNSGNQVLRRNREFLKPAEQPAAQTQPIVVTESPPAKCDVQTPVPEPKQEVTIYSADSNDVFSPSVILVSSIDDDEEVEDIFIFMQLQEYGAYVYTFIDVNYSFDIVFVSHHYPFI